MTLVPNTRGHTTPGHTGQPTTERIFGALTRNPEGLLLLAAGCALLLRSGGSAWSAQSARSTVPEGLSRAADQARDYAGRARDFAADVRDDMTETAGTYASKIGDYAEDARQTVMDQSGRIAAQAQSTVQSTVDRVMNQQPLAIALAGLAVGAAVAAVFPATEIEQRTLGPAGERLSEAAADAGRQLNKAASAAGERLKSAAEDRGLSAEGLKEMASDVAGTFGDTLKGGGKDAKGGGNTSASDQGRGSPGQDAYNPAWARDPSRGSPGQSGQQG
jgi:hypothetical protein